MSGARGGLSVPLATAYAAFAATFRGPRSRFWRRMTATGVVLGAMALAGEPSLRKTRVRPRDLALGTAAAGALYGIFLVGDRMARRIMPRGAPEIDAVYGLRSLIPVPEIAARLALVIAPAEELFWRGLVQSRLSRRYGAVGGAALAAAAYGGAHGVTGNATLVGAASVAGAFWSALAAAGIPMGALIASHALWDLLIFVAAPTAPASR
ncbi:MAG: CPBP family glutamic-type intramembrane protease [Actinomycetota bacterium]